MALRITVFLRLEGPLQAWGDSKLVVRRTAEAPTKSGVLGMICCAMGMGRHDAVRSPTDQIRKRFPKLGDKPILDQLSTLAMGVRIDRPGTLWSDYHTVGAGIGMLTAEGKLKTGAKGTLVTRREYLCDASFLVALQATEDSPVGLIDEICSAFDRPRWPVYLGRKACPPAIPVFVRSNRIGKNPGEHGDLRAALSAVEWSPRWGGEDAPAILECILEWRPTAKEPIARPEAEVWQDVPMSFDPPLHHPRLVVRDVLSLGKHVRRGDPLQQPTPLPPRPRANYGNEEYRKRRAARLAADNDLCVFCKAPPGTVQHVTYRRAGGDESLDDLRSLCRLCHDAVTMIEYGQGMGLDRINPEEPRWRDAIIAKRDEIIRFRSLATRRRRLAPEEVE